ncbi:MAG TPA: 3-deoxy-7-phosphoheptulonate synthase [Phototrophicaceae bacterium]|nr:3-deoxy-7-phosphoheptulonate synthase [Phototrophicaceae bacterium]
MIVVMKKDASASDISSVVERVKTDGYKPHLSEGDERTIIGLVGESPTPLREDNYSSMPGVEKVMRVSVPYKLASREYHPNDTLVALNGSKAGANKVLVIAGPCAVESREQVIETACAVKEAGATALRGGAYKPRTSPYSFQGHGEDGLKWLVEARERTGLPIVTEVMEPGLVEMVGEYADVLQIGARNMQNFPLLSAAGASQKTVLLKRGMAATMEDLLMSSEYILAQGNNRVMICERGIRTFEKYTRNTFDINAIPVLKARTHLPVIADPSHAVGYSEFVPQIALAAIAAGADGLIVEVHPDPAHAMSDGRQSLTYDGFRKMMAAVRQVAQAVGRTA